MSTFLTKQLLFGLCLLGFLAIPAQAQIESVQFSTNRNVKFF